MKKKKVAVVGHFMYGYEDLAVNGQTVKTENIYDQLCQRYGSNQVLTLDTNYFRKKLISNYVKLFNLCRKCDVVIIMPTSNGLKLLLPVLKVLKRIFGFKLLYPVIGGWLPKLLKHYRVLLKLCETIDAIYPETDKISAELRQLGLTCVETMYNFSLRKSISNVPDVHWGKKPYRFCTFSRVTKEKGIGEAIEVTNMLNANGFDCRLDIYGPIDSSYENEFKELQVSKYVAYKGVLTSDNIISTLKDYLLMLFPTYYHGEGMPGAVLEAFAAGVPVVASDWHNNSEVVAHGETGVIYELGDINIFYNAVVGLLEAPERILEMKNNCLAEYTKYAPDNILKPIYEIIDNE